MDGMHKYSGEESGNIGLGQTGFVELTGSVTSDTATYVAIKCIVGTATVSADSLVGDDLGGGVASGSGIALIAGDIIWGAFSKVKLFTIGKTILIYNG